MPAYDMTTDPATWPRPDDVDQILAQETWEATEDYESAAIDWAINDADQIAAMRDAYTQTADYDKAFDRWMQRQAP